MTIGNTYNQTSLDIADKQFKARQRSPSLIQKDKWHKEFLESGAQYRMSFAAFLKSKTKTWRKEKHKKARNKKMGIKKQSLAQAIKTETTFLSGKYQGQDIGKIYTQDSKYFIYILENTPKNVTAQQIILFFNRNPDLLK